MSDLAFAQATIDTLQPLIAKPTLKLQLLQKPPFRFLHDIVVALIRATQYPAGLYSEDQLVSENVKEKEQKLVFLQRLVDCTSHAVGTSIDCSPAKIIAGLEPEKTNYLLQCCAHVARNMQAIDMQQLVNKVDSNAQIGAQEDSSQQQQQQLLQQQQEAEAQQQAAMLQQQQQQQYELQGQQRQQVQAQAEANAAAEAQLRQQQEMQQQQQAALQQQQQQQQQYQQQQNQQQHSEPQPSQHQPLVQTQLPLSRPVIALPPPSNPQESAIECTQRLMSALISKPKMVDKLLLKPPFRFLHDCTTQLIAATGFPHPMTFQPHELDSANFTETQAKLEFLNKLIAVAQAATAIDLSQVNSKKIAAGLEHEQTNRLLQALAQAAASGVDSAAAAQLAQQQQQSGASLGSSAPAAATEAQSVPVSQPRASPPTSVRSHPVAQSADQDNTGGFVSRAAPPQSQTNQSAAASHQSIQPAAIAASPIPLGPGAGAAQSSVSSSGRPMTARKAPPRVKTNAMADLAARELAAQQANEEQMAHQVITEGAANIDADDAAPGEEESHTIGGADVLKFAPEDERLHAEDGSQAGEDQGKLVRDIMQAQLDPKQGQGMKLANSVNKTSLANQALLEAQRKDIQRLCISIAPLGACMDSAQDDCDMMAMELKKWKQMAADYTQQLVQVQKVTQETLEPLQKKLDETIARAHAAAAKVRSMQGTIIRNEATIAKLLQDKCAMD